MSLKISRILHAGYVFECDGTQIAFDPIFENPFSRNCYAFPPVQFDVERIKKLKLDAVFISHYHDDHCSLDSLKLLDRETTIYMFCVFEEIFSLIRALGFKKVYALELDRTIQLGSLEVTLRKALDEDVDSLFHIKAGEVNVLNVVDSWIGYDTLSLLQKTPWDLVLWPFQTMREIEVLSPKRALPPEGLPPEWLEQLKILNPKRIVPSSCQFQFEPWSWYNKNFFPITYKKFQQTIAGSLPEAQVIRMNPGCSISIDKKGVQQSEPLGWVVPIGDQDVDYDFKDNVTPPTTAQVACCLENISPQHMQRVLQYCEADILRRYESLAEAQSEYFLKTRHWKLSIFDHRGERIDFHYQIRGSRITPLAPSAESVAWLTEVPAVKLYAALEQGESLTSMYMRINDIDFGPEVESEMSEVDIVEDPLLRCLFEGVVGGYQLAQLKRSTEADT